MNTDAIWKLGIPFANSWRHFASANQRSKYDQLQENYGGIAYLNQLNELMDGRRDQPTTNQSLEFSDLPPMNFSLVSDFESQLKDQTLGWIRKGALIGYGFEKPRSSKDLPVRVPDDLWSHFIKWHKSTLTADSLTIESVRLVHRNHVIEPEKIAQDHKRSPGRPSRRPEVIDAYHSLRDRGQIDFSKSLGDYYDAIRHQVISSNPNDPAGEKGLGNEAIRRALRTLFEEDQSQHL